MTISLISEFTKDICATSGYSNRVNRKVVDLTLKGNLKSLCDDKKITVAQWSAYDSIWYGLHWYVQTGRASVQIENELNSLNGYQVIRLIVKIWLDGIKTSGNVGDWLQKWQGSYLKLISR